MEVLRDGGEKESFKIIVVEDDPYMQRFMKEFCELIGCEADFASSGVSALNSMEKEMPYGLAVVDFLMPSMHGVDFIRHAKKKWPHLPVIAISAFDNLEALFLEAGACLFLKKPFDASVLGREIALVAGQAL